MSVSTLAWECSITDQPWSPRSASRKRKRKRSTRPFSRTSWLAYMRARNWWASSGCVVESVMVEGVEGIDITSPGIFVFCLQVR